jgi:hypothetical protein
MSSAHAKAFGRIPAKCVGVPPRIEIIALSKVNVR